MEPNREFGLRLATYERMLTGFWSDLRLGYRRLLKHWGTSLLAIGILALGIGSTVEMYSLGQAILSPPVRLPRPRQISVLWQYRPNNYWPTVSPANYRDFKKLGRHLASLAAFRYLRAVMRLPGRTPLQTPSLRISPNFFHVLGVSTRYGRPFMPSKFQPGPAPAVILTYGFWAKRLHRQAGLIGRVIHLNGHQAVIVGIASPNLDFPLKQGILTPLALTARQWRIRKRGDLALEAVTRRRAGVTPAMELAGFQAIAHRLAALHPKSDKTLQAALISPAELVNGNLTPVFIHILLAGTLMLLLLICANVANLQLALGLRRTRELALRSALGAHRPRLLRQALMDSILLGLLGGAAGIFTAAWLCALLRNSLPARTADQVLGWYRIGINGHIIVFALVLAIACGLAAGLGPAWFASRPDVMEVLKQGGQRATGGKHWLRKALIIGQMALAFTLLVGATLAAKGFHQLTRQTAAYHGARRLTFLLKLPVKTYATPQSRLTFLQTLLPRLGAIPGVRQAALTECLPFSNGHGFQSWLPVTTARFQREKKSAPVVVAQPVSGNFFHLMRLSLLAGRNFTAQDGPHAPLVVIVSPNLARTLWPGQNPLGKILREPGKAKSVVPLTVVGVAPAIFYNIFNSKPDMAIYYPYAQAISSIQNPRDVLTRFAFVLQSRIPPLALARSVRRVVARQDPSLALARMKTLAGFFTYSNTTLRLIDRKMAVLGLEALLIAAVGLFGVIAAFMVERRREMGIRMILGAESKAIRGLAFRQGLRLTLWGMLISAPLAWIINRYLSHFLFGIAPLEWPLMLLVALLLALATLAACYVPARAAAGYDPINVLRSE